MDASITPIRATTLTPFAYHSLMVQSGSATLAEMIGDRAMSFAIASSLGMLAASVALPQRDYRRHLATMAFVSSVFSTGDPRLLPPLVRRLNLDAEAGLKEKVAMVAKKGNLKDYFLIQEVPPAQEFVGAVFGLNPFKATGQSQLVVRIGLHRAGMVKLEPVTRAEVSEVSLNASTAALFGRELPVARYCLHGLQLTNPMTLEQAAKEVASWR